MKLDILIVGVGGQGTLLASRVLGEIAVLLGLDCKLNEIHGMSQRGGSVVTHVRMGNEVFSPTILEGNADYIIAFEKLEALRWSYYLKEKGKIIVNNQKILPMPVILGKQDYPKNVVGNMKKTHIVLDVNAISIAKEINNPRAVNIILLGVFCALENIDIELGLKAILKYVKPQFHESNIIAFKKGYDIGGQYL
ncbi:MAG: indolepyruvate oxidoreductase subunit beta [Christensenellales bacterium]|jgi:indolepyruvate ferredoxin oxidoreductase beta subunit|nr:indolepyruvate oxidoreductase subunit beta [Clostridiales bacterium]